ncbi:MAG: uridine phosphorylase [Frankiales bacterium]|nr:uridine phosphorylase [Frankiales bacterium]
MRTVDRADWMGLLRLDDDDVPRLLVTEGTWWRDRAKASRLAHLSDVRELGMPDLWWGRSGGVPVAWCPAYGAARAVEPVHVLGLCGTPVAVQVGSCGGLQPHLRTGDVLVPTRATIGEGASRYYGGTTASDADPALVDAAARELRALGHRVHTGPSVSTDALLAQPDHLVASWAAAGHLGVDLETSAVLTAARAFGVRAASLLFVWDELPGRSWTAPFTEAERAAQLRAERDVFAVALTLAG